MSARRWFMLYLILTAAAFFVCAALTAYVDPYFHYHAPFTQKFFYALNNQRYQNDGITRHFEYDAVITGTSMTENFKASEFDSLFGCNSIKVPFSGGSYFEINNNQKVAFKNHSVKYMVRSLDYSHLADEKDFLPPRYEYPVFLYNENPLDDVKYLVNAGSLRRIAKMILSRKKGITGFDEYSNWNSLYKFGRAAVLENRKEFKAPDSIQELSTEEENRVRENVLQNMIGLAAVHPETQFYYFFPPYSIAYWGALYENGEIEKFLEREKIAIDLILDCKNIHLFSFNTKFDWITNLDNYKDTAHYGEWLNSEMLHLMKNDEYRITKENVDDYLQAEREFYMNFDYDRIFTE